MALKKRRTKRILAAAQDVYLWVEELLLKAVHENAEMEGQVRIPYSVIMGKDSPQYPGAELKVTIKIQWDGELDGYESETGN
jgi:hypothetical protein